jgi:hypothetical protein
MSYNPWMAEKYRILAQEADAHAQEARAQTALVNAKTGLLPDESAANVALTQSQAAHTAATTKTVAPLAQAQIGQANAGIAETSARTGLLGAQTSQTQQATDYMLDPNREIGYNNAYQYGLLRGDFGDTPGGHSAAYGSGVGGGGVTYKATSPSPSFPATRPAMPPGGLSSYRPNGGSSPFSLSSSSPILPGYAFAQGHNEGTEEVMEASAGASKVPGQGDGTVDTVAAKLAPGEAVLNKHAAEMLGRGMIKTLNDVGLAKRAMEEGAADPSKGSNPQEGYNKGTAKVPAKAPAKPAAKAAGKPKGKMPAVPPAVLAALLQHASTPQPAGPAPGGGGGGLLAAMAAKGQGMGMVK